MRRVPLLASTLLLVLPLTVHAARSDEDMELKDWSITFTPYFWLSNVRTDVDGEVRTTTKQHMSGLLFGVSFFY